MCVCMASDTFKSCDTFMVYFNLERVICVLWCYICSKLDHPPYAVGEFILTLIQATYTYSVPPYPSSSQSKLMVFSL